MFQRTRIRVALVLAVGVVAGYAAVTGIPVPWAGAQPPRTETPAAAALDRTALPIPEPKREPITEVDARKAKAPPRFEVKAPKGAPNVVIVLIDLDPRLRPSET